MEYPAFMKKIFEDGSNASKLKTRRDKRKNSISRSKVSKKIGKSSQTKMVTLLAFMKLWVRNCSLLRDLKAEVALRTFLKWILSL
jgi:hypothetical protein